MFEGLLPLIFFITTQKKNARQLRRYAEIDVTQQFFESSGPQVHFFKKKKKKRKTNKQTKSFLDIVQISGLYR